MGKAMRTALLLCLLTLCILASGVLAFIYNQPSKPNPPEQVPVHPPWFEDVTEKSGIHFIHDAGPVGTYFMPQQVGSGAALFDFDGDGRLDIYLLQNGGPNGQKNVLYKQMPDGKFVDVSKGSGLDIAGYN